MGDTAVDGGSGPPTPSGNGACSGRGGGACEAGGFRGEGGLVRGGAVGGGPLPGNLNWVSGCGAAVGGSGER